MNASTLARPDYMRMTKPWRGCAPLTEVVPIIRRVAAFRDPRDDRFLELALAGAAAAVISGDKDLLVLNPWHGFPS